MHTGVISNGDLYIGYYAKQAIAWHKAKCPYMNAELTTRAIKALQTSVSMDNLFQGRIPAKLCIALLPTANYNGQFDNNPFECKYTKHNYLATYVNGISMAGSPFEQFFSIPSVQCLRC